jgi:hypothetical protein
MLVATLQVNRLVAMGVDTYSSKLYYDVSKGTHTAHLSKCGISSSIPPEERDSLVVEGAVPQTHFRIAFNHPYLTSLIDCDAPPTVGGLIKLLHSHFHEPLRSREMFSLKSNMDLYLAAMNNLGKRCETSFDRDVQWKEWMKRIDVLGKECKFRGIELDTTSSHNYVTLRVAFGK